MTIPAIKALVVEKITGLQNLSTKSLVAFFMSAQANVRRRRTTLVQRPGGNCNRDARARFAAALGITLFRQKRTHFANDFILAINEATVIGVSEHDNPAVWNLSAEMFDFLLVVFPLCLEKLPDLLSLWLGQRLSRVDVFFVTDGEERKRWRFNFGVLGGRRITAFHHRVYCSTPLLPK